jgi:uncharacterized protein involved in outer membrane biogenesis
MILGSYRRIALVAAVVLLVAGVAAASLLVPGLARDAIVKGLAAQIGRATSVGQITVHPYRLGITLADVRVLEADGRSAMVTVREIDAGISPVSLLRLAPVINHLRITAPSVHIARLDQQHFNFTDILEKLEAQPKSASPVQFSINNIQITSGEITFDDAVTHAQHRVDQLTLSLPVVSNIRHDIDYDVDPALSARVDGRPVALKARTKPFAESLETSLEVQLDALELPLYVGYVPVALKPRVVSGSLSGVVQISFSKKSDANQQLGVSGHLILDKLQIVQPDGREAVAAERITVAIKNIDPAKGTVDVSAVEIIGPDIHVTRTRDGAIDLAELFYNRSNSPTGSLATPAETVDHAPDAAQVVAQDQPAAPAQTAGRGVHIGQFSVTGGRLHVRDEVPTKPFEITLGDIHGAITNVTTSGSAPAQLQLQFSPAAQQDVTVAGELTLARHHATLHFGVSGLALAPFSPLAGERIKARLEDGAVSTKVDAMLDWSAEPFAVKLTQIAGSLDHLRLRRMSDRAPLLAIEHVALEGGTLDLGERSLHLGSVTVRGLVADVVRDQAGVLNAVSLLGETPASPAVTPHVAIASRSPPVAPGATPPAFRLELGALELENGSLHYADATLPEKAALQIEKINLTARNVHLGAGAPIAFKLSAVANRKGQLDLAGEVVPAPFSIVSQVSARQVPVAAFQAYAPQQLNITINSADVTLHGRVRMATEPAAEFHFAGALSVTDFAALDRISGDDFLSWKSLDLASLAIDTGAAGRAAQVQIGDVVAADFYSRLIVYPDGRINVQDIMSNRAAAQGKSLTNDTPTADASPVRSAPLPGPGHETKIDVPPSAASDTGGGVPPVVRLKSVTFRNGSINFTDNFVKPNYTTAISSLGGTVSSVASNAPAPADVALHGSLEGNGDLSVTGKINPLSRPLYLDLAASAKDIELTRLSAYSIKYAGYNIEKGKLSMTVQYHIENNQLTAQNHLFLDQLTFGEHVENSTATKLPVLLAVSLLTNGRGEIDVNLPISGSLSDPQFSMGGVIVRVIVNLLEKAVLSPFALLSSIGGGSGAEELGYVEFAPGHAELSAAAEAKLDKLAGLLADRPALKIDIVGRANRNADTNEARSARLAARVKGQKYRELLNAGQTTPFDEIVVTPEEYPKYLEALYKEMDFEKQKSVIGLTKSLPVPEMETLIRANMPVDDEDLRTLAYRRASAVRAALEKGGKIALARIFLVAPKLDDESGAGKGPASRVEFTLR